MGVTQSLGNLVVNLGLVTDERSFAMGLKGLNGVEIAVKAIAGTALKAAGAIFGMATASGLLANSEEKASRSIGLSTTELEKWKVACDKAGVNSKNLIDSMARLEEKAQRWKLGFSDDGLADNLARLGSGINMLDFNAMDAESRIRAVFAQALSMDDQKQAAVLVGDILGEAGEDLYRKLQSSGQSLDALLKEAKGLMFMNDEASKQSEAFSDELNELKAAIKQISVLFGAELADTLLPIIRELNTALAENKDNIIAFIHAITHPGEKLKGGAEGAASAALGLGAPVVVEPVNTDKYTSDSYLSYLEEELKKSDEIMAKKGWHPIEKLNNERLRSEIELTKKSQGIQDGIIAPGGRVTQVAPDDWVIAARDLGKVAGAFYPKQTGPQTATFTINQTITVNGARDVSAAVKNAAYSGANKAFTEMTIKSDNYLQLMPAR